MDATTTVHQGRALWLSTIAFTVCFAVWTIFSIIGIQIKQELGLNDTQFGLLVGTPILTGSLIRLVLGIWTDQYGGRRRLHASSCCPRRSRPCLLTYAHTTIPTFLLAALGVGIAGGSFAVGIAYVSRWYPDGASRAPRSASSAPAMSAPRSPSSSRRSCMVAYGWQTSAQVWAAGHRADGASSSGFTTKDDPVLAARRAQRRASPTSALA